MSERILRLPEVLHCYGKSRSTLYSEIDRGLFPEGIDLGGRLRGWPESELDALIRARIAGKTDGEIKELVSALHARRTAEVR
jgi:prophage regulatory protein